MKKGNESHLVWEDLGSETLYDAKIFSLKTVHRQSADGRKAPFISVHAPDWVTVIPELAGHDGELEFLIVKQYRHGTRKVGLEFPAGVIDPGETPAEAAARELLEETGFRAGELVEIGAVSPNPAFMTNTTYTYMARDLERVSDKLDLDENEILEVHVESFDMLKEVMGREPYDSAITAQAWYFYLRSTGKI